MMQGRKPPDKFDIVVWRAGFVAMIAGVIVGLAMFCFPLVEKEVLTRQQAIGVVIVIPCLMTAWFLAKDHELNGGD